MRAIAHTSTRATSLMRVKNSTPPLLFITLSGAFLMPQTVIERNENERKIKNIKLNNYLLSLTFGNLLLAWMLYFHVWLLNKRKVWSECHNQFGIYQIIPSIPLRTTAKQLKKSRGIFRTMLDTLDRVFYKKTFFCKTLHLRCFKEFWNTSL